MAEKTTYQRVIRDKGFKILWIQIPEDTADLFQELAVKEGSSRGPFCRKILEEWLENHDHEIKNKTPEPPQKSKGWNRK